MLVLENSLSWLIGLNEAKVNDSLTIMESSTEIITIHNVASLAGLTLNGFGCCSLWSIESEIFQPEAFVAFKLVDETGTQSEGESVSSENSGA